MSTWLLASHFKKGATGVGDIAKMNNPEKSESAQAHPPSYDASPMQMGSPMMQQSFGPMSPQPQYAASPLHHQPPPFAQQMFAQPQYAASPQTYGQQEVESVEEEDHPECRVIGFITAPIWAILWLFYAAGMFGIFAVFVMYDPDVREDASCHGKVITPITDLVAKNAAVFSFFGFLGSLLVFAFHIIVCVPGYTSGSPKWTKFIPALLGTFLTVLGLIVAILSMEPEAYYDMMSNAPFIPICVVPLPVLLTVFSYFSYMGDDESDSCWLRFKTLTNKKQPKMII